MTVQPSSTGLAGLRQIIKQADWYASMGAEAGLASHLAKNWAVIRDAIPSDKESLKAPLISENARYDSGALAQGSQEPACPECQANGLCAVHAFERSQPTQGGDKGEAVAKHWYLASMNDGLFIIDTPPRPSNDDVWPDRSDGPTVVINVTEISAVRAKAIVDVLNEQYAAPQPASNAYPAWQPIETAPKDETRILLYQKGRGSFEGWWKLDWPLGEYWMDDADSEPEPTHWQPLLPAPSVPSTPSKTAAPEPHRWPAKGDRMKFLGKNGYPFQLADALKVFTAGQIYVVSDCEVGSFTHSVKFEGIEGCYNGVMFERTTELPSTQEKTP